MTNSLTVYYAKDRADHWVIEGNPKIEDQIDGFPILRATLANKDGEDIVHVVAYPLINVRKWEVKELR